MSPTQPLSIIHVFRAPIGGLFRHVIDLVRGQLTRGHKVGIIADSTTGNVRSDEILAELTPRLALGLTCIPIRRSLSPIDAPAILHVTRRMRETGADVIHGHGAKGGAYARLATASPKVVRAYTPHGGSLLLRHDNLSGRLYLTLERMLLARRALYLFESAYSAQIFRFKVGSPKGTFRVIHNGVSQSEFAPVEPAADATDLVFIGEFRPVKGIDILLAAINLLHRRNLPVTATLVGGGPDETALRMQVARLSLSRSVRFHPPVPARDALTFGRVVVIPSLAESLPYVVLESAAAGVPIITTRVGGIPEIYCELSDTLIEAGNAELLAEAIDRTLNNPEDTKTFAKALRERVSASFSVDAMVDEILAAYRQVFAEMPGR